MAAFSAPLRLSRMRSLKNQQQGELHALPSPSPAGACAGRVRPVLRGIQSGGRSGRPGTSSPRGAFRPHPKEAPASEPPEWLAGSRGGGVLLLGAVQARRGRLPGTGELAGQELVLHLP